MYNYSINSNENKNTYHSEGTGKFKNNIIEQGQVIKFHAPDSLGRLNIQCFTSFYISGTIDKATSHARNFVSFNSIFIWFLLIINDKKIENN